MEVIGEDIDAKSLNEDILLDKNKWRSITNVVDPI